MTSTACCSGSEHPGTPKGSIGTLYGLPTYVAEPTTPSDAKAVIVIVPDAFGYKFVNLQLLADTFAERLGARCLLPEFMNGKAANLPMLMNMKDLTNDQKSYLTRGAAMAKVMFEFIPFRYNNRIGVVWPRVESFFKSLREDTALPVGVIGYCYGGYYAVRLADGTLKTTAGKPVIDAACAAHPSLLTLPGDTEKVKVPLFVTIGDKDVVVGPKEVEGIREVFIKKNQEEQVPGHSSKADDESKDRYVMKAVEGATHGFSVRGDPNDKFELEKAQEAEDGMVAWFERWLY